MAGAIGSDGHVILETRLRQRQIDRVLGVQQARRRRQRHQSE